MRKDLQARIQANSSVDIMTGCWLWNLKLVNNWGYGCFAVRRPNRNTYPAHKVAWVLKFGRIPKGLELHHRCEVKRCCNPEHLELLTHAEHQRRHPNILTTNQLARTKCPAGHSYDAANTYISKDGKRQCRACHREREALRRLKNRQ